MLMCGVLALLEQLPISQKCQVLSASEKTGTDLTKNGAVWFGFASFPLCYKSWCTSQLAGILIVMRF